MYLRFVHSVLSVPSSFANNPEDQVSLALSILRLNARETRLTIRVHSW
jgi:hypothetical protein